MYATSKDTIRVHSTTDTDADTAMIIAWLDEDGELFVVVCIMSVNI